MKIMQLCFSPIVNSAGGAEKVFCDMANHYSKEHDVINICCDNIEGKPFYSLNEKVQFINLAGKNKISIPKRIKYASEILRILKKIGMHFTLPKIQYKRKIIGERLRSILVDEQPDIIICYELDSAMLLKMLEFPKEKIVVMYHNKIEYFLRSMSVAEKQFLQTVRFNQVLLQSDKIALEENGFNNVVCIGNIVPHFAKYNKHEKVILHVGRLDKKQKRQHLAIDAFAKIADKYPEWKIRFIGDNSVPKNYKDELVKMVAAYGLQDRIELVGIRHDVREELLRAGFFVFPSAFEGFPLAMTEAMSAGLPVIGFKDTPAVNELIIDGENGILCNSNCESFAASMARLIEDEALRTTMGTKASESLEQYCEENIYSKWNEVLLLVKGK